MGDPTFQPQKLTKEQKVGFVFLLVFALLTIGLTGLQLRNTIYGPFVIRVADDAGVQDFLETDENTRLQGIDTDKDGLSDYEELFFYETSPYIEDTDSDGVSDKEELDAGDDPLCPVGKVCASEEVPGTDEDPTFTSALLGDVPTPADVLGGAGINVNAPADALADIETLRSNPDQLRKLLLSTGKITTDELADVDDDALLKLLDTSLGQVQVPEPVVETGDSTTVIPVQ